MGKDAHLTQGGKMKTFDFVLRVATVVLLAEAVTPKLRSGFR
jgi:hypothetical protein